MLVLLLVSGLGGAFFHYAYLRGVVLGSVSKSFSVWARCVAASALLLAVSASVITRYFYPDAPYALTIALWPLFMLALEPGYRVVSCARDVVSRDIEDR